MNNPREDFYRKKEIFRQRREKFENTKNYMNTYGTDYKRHMENSKPNPIDFNVQEKNTGLNTIFKIILSILPFILFFATFPVFAIIDSAFHSNITMTNTLCASWLIFMLVGIIMSGILKKGL